MKANLKKSKYMGTKDMSKQQRDPGGNVWLPL